MIDPIKLAVTEKYKSLRAAKLDDVPWLIEKAMKAFEASPYAAMDVDLFRSRQMLEKFIIEGQKEYLALVSTDEFDTPVGAVVAYAFQPIFSSRRIAVEVLLFVEEEFRSSRRGIALMDAYEYWAKLVGCSFVQYGHLSSSPSGMIDLYKRRGLEQTETVFQKRV